MFVPQTFAFYLYGLGSFICTICSILLKQDTTGNDLTARKMDAPVTKGDVTVDGVYDSILLGKKTHSQSGVMAELESR